MHPASSIQHPASSKGYFMKTGKMAFTALFSALLMACSSSPDARKEAPNSDPNTITRPSLTTVPEQYRSTVIQQKTIDLEYKRKIGGDEITFTTILEGKEGEERYSFSNLPLGRSDLSIFRSYGKSDDNPTIHTGSLLVYQQPYSVVMGHNWSDGSGPGYHPNDRRLLEAYEPLGLLTPLSAFLALHAQNITFNYTGVAFDRTIEQGTLNYTMNFGTQEGSGSITGLSSTGTIDLQAASLDMGDNGIIKGNAFFRGISPSQQDAKYQLSFYGPNAEEIAGVIGDADPSNNLIGKTEIIFAGERK